MRVTIIGHGPSSENTGLGKFIDDTDGYVVRLFKSYLSCTSLDHGNRTDYICTTINGSNHALKCSKPLHETWVYFPRCYVTKAYRVEKLRAEGFNPIICNDEIKPWLLRYKELNNEWIKTYLKKNDRKTYLHFSVGMAALIIAMQRIEHVDELLLVGFDNLTKGSRDNFVSIYSKKEVVPNVSGHNYAVERQLLDEIVLKLGIKLIIK